MKLNCVHDVVAATVMLIVLYFTRKYTYTSYRYVWHMCACHCD